MKTAAVILSLGQLALSYNDDIKPCWDIRLKEDAFCNEAIKYPLSTDTFYQTAERDAEAKIKYDTLRQKWEDGGKGSPSNHCLAIARDFYCFTVFPRCESNEV